MQESHPGSATTEAGTTTVVATKARRTMGISQAVGISALCLVSAGLGAAAASGSVFAADANQPVATTGVNDAAGDNQVIIDVVKLVSPAVVTINVTTNATNSSAPGQTPQGFVQGGTGSGVIIDADGLILTNHHVVQNADTVSVVLADGRTFDGTVAGVDTYTDLAFVKIDATGLPTAELGDSSALQIGQLAIAMGDPLGEFPGSVTSGIVSGLDRTIVVSDVATGEANQLAHLIQTDAAINPGNSGGPLLDGDGKVIGIDTAQAGSSTGIGFAIPIDLAKPIITQVQAGQPIARPWIGIYYRVLDAQVAKDNDLKVESGAWIHTAAGRDGTTPAAIVADGPAADAGLKDGDIITAIDGQAIDALNPLDVVLLSHAPGDVIKLTVLRDGAEQSIDLKLGTRPAEISQ